MEQGASQEEISEGICTPETYSRIETGKRSPSLKNLEALKSRLKIRSGYYMGEVWTEDFAVLELVQELRAAVSASNLKAWEMCQQRLEEKLDLSKKINRQYTEGYRTCLEYQKGKFLEDEWIRRHRKTLSYTRKEPMEQRMFCEERAHVFTNTETILLQQIALAEKSW